MKPLLLLLLPQLVLDVTAKGHITLPLIAVLSMVATKVNEFLTYATTSTSLSLAILGVFNHTLHLGTAWQLTAGVMAVGSMNQTLDAALDLQAPFLLRIDRSTRLSTFLVLLLIHIKVKTQSFHLVFMSSIFVTRDTQIVILKKS